MDSSDKRIKEWALGAYFAIVMGLSCMPLPCKLSLVTADALDAELQTLHQGLSEKVGLLNHNQSLGTAVESLLELYDFGLDEINLRRGGFIPTRPAVSINSNFNATKIRDFYQIIKLKV